MSHDDRDGRYSRPLHGKSSLEETTYDDWRYNGGRYSDRRIEDRRYEDRRYEDRRYEDRRYGDCRYEARRRDEVRRYRHDDHDPEGRGRHGSHYIDRRRDEHESEDRRHRFHRSRSASPTRSRSKSRSPDEEVKQYLAQQAKPASPSSEEHKRQRIAAGGMFNVKSRHERERDEAARKKKEEDESAAKAYEEFAADMESAGSSRLGGLSRRPSRGRSSASGFVRTGGSAYTPSARQPGAHGIEGIPSAPRAMRQHAAQKEAFEDESKVEIGQASEGQAKGHDAPAPGKKKGIMQDFLGEIQRNQAQREERLRNHITGSSSVSSLLAQEMAPVQQRPRDEDDANSSNICILNLPGGVSEPAFAEYFSQHGDVASVKIMWPRIEDTVPLPSNVRTTKHPGATGFINYMRRSDAEVAYKEMDGALWGESQIHTAWGKSLPKPLRPLFTRADYERIHGTSSRKDMRAPRNRKRRSSRSPDSRNHRRQRDNTAETRDVLRKLILENHDGLEQERVITAVASRVRDYGAQFEKIVKERESGNPLYVFLEASESIEHQYYLCSLDNSFVPALPAPKFKEDGDASSLSSDTEEDSEWEKMQALGQHDMLGAVARRRLDAMLRGLNLRRERIARLMTFAIEYASAAESVTERLIDSVLVSSTPLPRKLARLFVISDILHNATASGAWRYRSLFESRLDTVFAHWGDVANSFTGRIKREACKDMVRELLTAWETWLVFEAPRLAQWRALIDIGSVQQGEERSAGQDAPRDELIQSNASAREQSEDKNERMDARKDVIQTAHAGHLDGEAIDGEDIDGEGLDGEGLDEEVKDRDNSIAGQNLDGEEVDGEAIEDE